MNRNFLENLGLEKDAIDSIMKEYGKAIQAAKPADDYEEIKERNAVLEKENADLQTSLTATNEKYAEIDKTIADKDDLIKNYETKSMKLRIATQNGLPIDLADRLTGETEDDLKSDAEKLASLIVKPAPLPLRETEPPAEDKETQAYSKMLNDLDI